MKLEKTTHWPDLLYEREERGFIHIDDNGNYIIEKIEDLKLKDSINKDFSLFRWNKKHFTYQEFENRDNMWK